MITKGHAVQNNIPQKGNWNVNGSRFGEGTVSTFQNNIPLKGN